MNWLTHQRLYYSTTVQYNSTARHLFHNEPHCTAGSQDHNNMVEHIRKVHREFLPNFQFGSGFSVPP
jgi:hypothetical protein